MTLRLPTGEELAAELAPEAPGAPRGDSHWCIKVAAEKDSSWAFQFAQTAKVDPADAHCA
jgi:hypothetical protein